MGYKVYMTKTTEVTGGSFIYRKEEELLIVKKSLRQQRDRLKKLINKGGKVYDITKAVEELKDCQEALEAMPDYINGENEIGFPK